LWLTKRAKKETNWTNAVELRSTGNDLCNIRAKKETNWTNAVELRSTGNDLCNIRGK
jgi:hypothetical protein